jgi:hypothetical protein
MGTVKTDRLEKQGMCESEMSGSEANQIRNQKNSRGEKLEDVFFVLGTEAGPDPHMANHGAG